MLCEAVYDRDMEGGGERERERGDRERERERERNEIADIAFGFCALLIVVYFLLRLYRIESNPFYNSNSMKRVR